MRSSQIVDVLTDLLQRSRARGAAFAHTTVHGDWGVRFPAGPRISVHAVVAGEAHLWAAAPEQALRLVPGDIVLVRESTHHQMAHAPGARCIPFADLPLDPTGRRRVTAGDGPATVFFCGAYDFQGDLVRSTLDSLPATFQLRPEPGSTLRATMDLLGREMLRDEPGQQALLDRLLDVALVQVLREHFTARDAHAPAWFRASGDPHIGAALPPCTPTRRASGRWPTSPPRRRCRARRSRGSFTELLGRGAARLPQPVADGAGARTAARQRPAPGGRRHLPRAMARSSRSRRRSSATTDRPRAAAGRVARRCVTREERAVSGRALQTLLEGGSFFEGPRWHDGRWWVSDFYRQRVLAVDPDGRARRVLEVEGQPSGLGLDARRLDARRLDARPPDPAAVAGRRGERARRRQRALRRAPQRHGRRRHGPRVRGQLRLRPDGRRRPGAGRA